MKPSVAEAMKAKAFEELAKKYDELSEKLDRIEAKIDALSGVNAKPAKVELPKK